MRAEDRYSQTYLSQLANPNDEKFKKRQARKKRKAMQERMLKNEGISMHFGDDDDAPSDGDEGEELLCSTQVEGSNYMTFYALQNVFSSAVCRTLAPKRQGCFPTEIYQCILSFVTDATTRDACMRASTILREICLQDYLFCEADGSILRSCDACEEDYVGIPEQWNLSNLHTEGETRVTLKRGRSGFLDLDQENDYTVMVGCGHGKKSMLSEASIKFGQFRG